MNRFLHIFVRISKRTGGALGKYTAGLPYSRIMHSGKIITYTVSAVALLVMISACNRKQDIFDSQMDTILSWVEKNNSAGENYAEVISGVYGGIISPDDGQGSPLAEKGDSLYLWYEIYRFSASFSVTGKTDLVYTNVAELIPERVSWSSDILKIKLGGGSILKGVEESLTGSAPGDLVVVVMTSSNAYGDHTVQQLAPNTPLAWRLNVNKVIKEE